MHFQFKNLQYIPRFMESGVEPLCEVKLAVSLAGAELLKQVKNEVNLEDSLKTWKKLYGPSILCREMYYNPVYQILHLEVKRKWSKGRLRKT